MAGQHRQTAVWTRRTMGRVIAMLALTLTLAHAVPTNFACDRSMEVGEQKPMDPSNTIVEGDDRSIDSVDGVPCGGAVATNVASTVAYTLPSSSYRWLIEAKGVAAVFGSPFSGCDDRQSGSGDSTSITVTFLEAGTVTLRMLASLGSSQDATTTVTPDCVLTVVSDNFGSSTEPPTPTPTPTLTTTTIPMTTTLTTSEPITTTIATTSEPITTTITTTIATTSEPIVGTTTATIPIRPPTSEPITTTFATMPETTVAEVDECSLGTHSCSVEAVCTDTFGSFFCTCFAGFEGDGLSCNDVDECAEFVDNCSPLAVCTNTLGSFVCTCAEGDEGDGIVCVPQTGFCGDGNLTSGEECDDGNTDNWDGCTASCKREQNCMEDQAAECHVLSYCFANPENTSDFQCVCPPGYCGDGFGRDGCVECPDDCMPGHVYSPPGEVNQDQYRCCESAVKSWQDVAASRSSSPPGRFRTGGLGRWMDAEYLVWLCDAAHECGGGGDSFCFAYHEVEERFIPWGKNSELGLVPQH